MGEANRTVVVCPECRQQLRVPTDRGNLRVICPSCRHSWDCITITMPPTPSQADNVRARRRPVAKRTAGIVLLATCFIFLAYVLFSNGRPSQERLELREAVAKGLIRVSAFGNGLQSVSLSVETDSNRSLEITVPAGTLFRPNSTGQQNMLACATTTFILAKKMRRQQINVDAACINMHKPTPMRGDRLTLSYSEQRDDLTKLIICPDFRNKSFRVQQFAVWTVTDNPDRSQYVGIVGTENPGDGGPPSFHELEDIRALFGKARIPVVKYRVFSRL
jgi:hypothetical protein